MSLVVIKNVIPKKPSIIKISFGMWCGISTIVGFNGMLIEHDRIQKYAYSQCGISKFEQHMESFDFHLNAIIVYGFTFMSYPITRMIYNTSFFESIESKRNKSPRLLLPNELYSNNIEKIKLINEFDISLIDEKFKNINVEPYFKNIISDELKSDYKL